MKIDLTRVDEFERQFGQVAAFRRARDFMIDYVSKIRNPLPVVAAEGLAIARKFQDAEVGSDQLQKARINCWNYLDERSASTDFATPEYCVIRAAICFLDQGSVRGGDAIDLVDLFLDLMGKFETPSNEAAVLLREYFPLEQIS
jgi:hypothetical protein